MQPLAQLERQDGLNFSSDAHSASHPVEVDPHHPSSSSRDVTEIDDVIVNLDEPCLPEVKLLVACLFAFCQS